MPGAYTDGFGDPAFGGLDPYFGISLMPQLDPTPMRIEMALGGSWRTHVSDLNPTVWYRFQETTGTVAKDTSGNGNDGTYVGGFSLKQAATVPDGGFAVQFDGVDGRVTFGPLTAFTTTLSYEFWIKPNSPSADGTIISGTTGTTRIRLRSTLFLDVFYSAASHLSSVALVDQVWSHVVVSINAGSGTIYINGVAQGTFTSFPTGSQPTRIGRYDTAEPLKAWLDEIAVYGGQALSASDAVNGYLSGLWTDVTDDVLVSQQQTMTQGIDGNGPTDHIATPGSWRFWFDNSTNNSVHLLGYYSPGHPNCRSGFTFGVLTRISFSYLNVWYQRFIGKTKTIIPEQGRFNSRRTSVTVADLFTDLVETDLRNVVMQVNKSETELLEALVNALPISARPLANEFDPALYTITYAFDNLGPGQKAIQPASDIMMSVLGFLYTTRFGLLKYENNQHRQVTDSLYTFDNNLLDMDAVTSFDSAYNHVRLTVHPKRLDTAATTDLWSLFTNAAKEANTTDTSRVQLAAGETREIWGDYFNPANTTQKIGGTAQVTPAATTDYKANTLADASGSDKTGMLTVTADFFASTVKFTVTNNDAGTVSVTKLKCRGKGLYDESPTTVESTSVQPYGDRQLNIDLQYQESVVVAQDFADYIRLQFETADGLISKIKFSAHDNESFMMAALTIGIGDRITISEEVTGIMLVDTFVQKITIDVDEGRILWVELGVAPTVFGTEFWILEDPASALGTNTYSGFA